MFWPPRSERPPETVRCGEPGVARPRKCARRVAAERSGDLMWSPLLNAYVLHSAPLRAVSQRAAYYAEERGVKPRPGEHYTWTCCPWCGGDLLPPESYLVFGQGDGDEG